MVTLRARSVLVLLGAALVLTSEPALAATINCPNTGSDSCVGTQNDDVLIGTNDLDNMSGLGGDDVLKGRGGDDNTLRGDNGADRVLGGAGDDLMDGEHGKDVLRGQAGYDTYNYGPQWGKEVIVDTPILDSDLNTNHWVRFDLVTGDLTIRLNSGPRPEVKNAAKTSTLNWASDLIDAVVDGAGDDMIRGRPVADNIQVFGGRHDSDTILAGGGSDFLYTVDDDGNDFIDCGPGANDEVRKDPGDTAVNCEVVN
jgi:Ca2+-binding RTX toxin-like protein